MKRKTFLIWLLLSFCGIAWAIVGLAAAVSNEDGPAPESERSDAYVKQIQPLLKTYCFECHSKKAHKGDLDLERFESLGSIRKDLRPWQHLIEQVEAGEMPPKGKPQPSAAERKALLAWVRAMLDAEARSRAGDPGRVPLRRLSNAEYECTIRDLTGVDLRPTREFPADGAAGEGFTNAAESLSDITPALFTRYLSAAKDSADHAVLLPDGFRFSPGKTRRDWSDESVGWLRQFYAAFTGDGRLAFQPYLLATVRHRDAVVGGKISLAQVAEKEKLNAKYLGVLWQTLTNQTLSPPLEGIRAKWRMATETDVPALTAEIAAWQTALWKFVPIGSYRYFATTRQVANDPAASASGSLTLTVKPAPGQSEVVLYLAARDLSPAEKDGQVVWHRPRFEAAGKAPLLLKDYPQFGATFEVDHAAVFADAAKYLAAVAEMSRDRKQSVEESARKNKLDLALLKRWTTVLDLGNKDVWSFVRGPAKAPAKNQATAAAIPPGSILGQWRAAVTDPANRARSDELAAKVQALLTGPRPTKEKDPDRVLFDAMVSADGALLKELDLTRFAKPRSDGKTYGLPKERFEEADLMSSADSVVEVRLPAALFRDREFVVDCKLAAPPGERVVLFDVTTTPGHDVRWNGKSPIVASPTSAAFKRLLAGFDEFRRTFPWYLCFPNVVPTDETVSLKMFHREDEPLERLFLDAEQKRRIDRLWEEHRFISQQPLAENNYLPQFIGFVTQDQPKALLDYFESQRPVFKKRADEFEKDLLAAEPKQLAALADFAARAYRRPLKDKEKAELLDLYQRLRKKGTSHGEAFRGALTRVLVAPPFLFRIETAPPGVKAGPIDDWELAARLSYFLWSSAPDDEMRRLAAAGQLHEPNVLAEQARRMLKDNRVRSLAIEFGAQWIHVRGFDALKEKNEKLYPTFNPELRAAIYEETILCFLDFFQSDRAAARLLDADYTFLNESLAKHYGIPGVTGPQWRRVEGVRKFGRGGILGLASVQAKQSGASRTSPVLRGNWVVEVLLGEKLPRPPANVPILPDEQGEADKLTTRQQVEKHVSNASCAVCHVRIDPFGFAFENFDAIGRLRVKEPSGLPVDARAKLKDGTEFTGIDGLREYLLTKKKDVIMRLFCQRLLGYALGRATTLADTSLIDALAAELNKNDGRISAAVLAIVRSPQFRMIRGSEFDE